MIPSEWTVTWRKDGKPQKQKFKSFSRLRAHTLRINRAGAVDIDVQISGRSPINV
jgi:hypothetical protein